MNAIDLHHELDKLRSTVTTLQAERAEYVRRRDSALAVEPNRFDQNHVDAAKRGITRVEHQIVNVQERIAALEPQLPTPEETRAALAEASDLSKQIQATHSEFNAAWSQFMTQIEGVVDAARAVTLAATEGRIRSTKLRDLVARFALDLPLLRDVPLIDPNDVQIAGAVSQIILGVADHQVMDDQSFAAFVARRQSRLDVEPVPMVTA
jgi:hypothetical protein